MNLEKVFDNQEVIRACMHCDSIELPEGGLIRISKRDKEKLGSKLTHTSLSLECSMKDYEELKKLCYKRNKSEITEKHLKGLIKKHEEGSNEDKSNNYLACQYSIPILVVDDALVNRKLFERILRKTSGLPYQIDLAENGFEALKKLEQKPYQFIVTDGEMGEMEGPELIDKIREMNSDIPVALWTGNIEKFKTVANEKNIPLFKKQGVPRDVIDYMDSQVI
jgi:CheY-like chemotaxis protein